MRVENPIRRRYPIMKNPSFTADVIFRCPVPSLTPAQKRDCEVLGLRIGRTIHPAPTPIKVKVYRQKGYWVHELEEFRIWSAEPDFVTSRNYFGDHLLHYYNRFTAMKPATATRGAMEWKTRLQELFSLRVRIRG